MKGLMVIAICESKEEDTASQILFWESLNAVMTENGHPIANFSGFMADEAGANWNAIRAVYNKGADNEMEGRERSCLFHWEQSLQKKTRKLIPSEKQMEHISLCEKWRSSTTMMEAQRHAASIKRWWDKASVPAENKFPLKKWFSWWEDRISHWGGIAIDVSIFLK